MRVTLDATPALSAALPDVFSYGAVRARGTQTHVEPRQRYLAHVAQAPFTGDRSHSAVPGAVYFTAAELTRGFRMSRNATAVERLIGPLYDYPRGRRGFHRGRGLAKAYTPKPELAAVVGRVLTEEPLAAYREADDGERTAWDVLSPWGVPTHLADAFPVPKVLPLSVAAVHAAAADVAAWAAVEGPRAPLDLERPPDGRAYTLEEAGRALVGYGAWCRSVGGLANLYRLEEHGRLGGVGPSVVGMPRLLRALLLRGSGLADYDMHASNWRLYLSAVAARGWEVPAAAAYVADRAAHHAEWAKATGCPVGALKAVALSWLTGGGWDEHPECAAVKALDVAGLRALRDTPSAYRLWAETTATMPKLGAELLPPMRDGKHTVYENHVGAVLRARKGKPITEARKATYLLAGLEQAAMRAIGPHVRGLAAVIYDGLLAPEQDVGTWAGIVADVTRSRLGFPLHVAFERKPFTVPSRPREPLKVT